MLQAWQSLMCATMCIMMQHTVFMLEHTFFLTSMPIFQQHCCCKEMFWTRLCLKGQCQKPLTGCLRDSMVTNGRRGTIPSRFTAAVALFDEFADRGATELRCDVFGYMKTIENTITDYLPLHSAFNQSSLLITTNTNTHLYCFNSLTRLGLLFLLGLGGARDLAGIGLAPPRDGTNLSASPTGPGTWVQKSVQAWTMNRKLVAFCILHSKPPSCRSHSRHSTPPSPHGDNTVTLGR